MVSTASRVGTGITIPGGGKKIAKTASVLVPIMSVTYIIVAFIVIFKNIGLIPSVFADIFSQAFDFKAIFGGFMGSAPNAAAAADVSHPVKQGLVQMMAVYLDTWVICTATAIMLLASGVGPSPDIAGAAYNVAALSNNFGALGQHFFTITLFLFGFTTLIGNYFYSEANLKYLIGKDINKNSLTIFRSLADVLMAAMAQRNSGKDPVFNSSSIGLKDVTDFWNDSKSKK